MESTSVARSGEGAGPDALPGDDACDAAGVPAESEEDGEDACDDKLADGESASLSPIMDAGDSETAGDCAAGPDSAGAGVGANIVPVAATITIF